MAATYQEFFVYDLKDNGEKKKIDIKQEDLQKYLHPEQVLVIVREDLRRIFIWKGAKSPVRKRFISSRVARDIQLEFLDDPRYHRCKIISVDQGDEQKEFLDAFTLKSMEVEERLPDMHYIRNIERERMESSNMIQAKTKEPYISPALQDTNDNIVKSSVISTPTLRKPSTYLKTLGLSKEEQQKIKNKILETEVPENYKRQNLILGYTLFAAFSKKAKVFDEDVEEIVWEPVKKIPKDKMDIDNHKLRVYFDSKKGIVQAIEILKRKTDLNKEKKPKPKNPPSKAPKSSKKSPLTPMPQKPNLLKENQKAEKNELTNNSKTLNKRQLPKIPSDKK
jgi:hypothetical protein